MLIDTGPDLACAFVNLDHFKRINDQLSHDVGDQVLVQVAKLLDTELAAVSPDGFVPAVHRGPQPLRGQARRAGPCRLGHSPCRPHPFIP